MRDRFRGPIFSTLKRSIGEPVEIVRRDGDIVRGLLVEVSMAERSASLQSIDPQSDAVERIEFSAIRTVRQVDLDKEVLASIPLIVRNLTQKLVVSEDGSVILTKLEDIVPVTPGVQSVKDKLTCSGFWRPGELRSSLRPEEYRDPRAVMDTSLRIFADDSETIGQVEYQQIAHQPLLTGRTYRRETHVPFPPATYLVDPEDSFSHEVVRPEGHLTIEIQFPRGASPDAVMVTRSTPASTQEHVTSLVPVGGQVRFALESPRFGATYRLSWLNSEEVRKGASVAAGTSADEPQDGDDIPGVGATRG